MPKKVSKTEFKGIPSGDYEAFCWDVDLNTFVKITGEQPKTYDESMFNEGMYRIYPSQFFKGNKPIKMTIICEE